MSSLHSHDVNGPMCRPWDSVYDNGLDTRPHRPTYLTNWADSRMAAAKVGDRYVDPASPHNTYVVTDITYHDEGFEYYLEFQDGVEMNVSELPFAINHPSCYMENQIFEWGDGSRIELWHPCFLTDPATQLLTSNLVWLCRKHTDNTSDLQDTPITEEEITQRVNQLYNIGSPWHALMRLAALVE